MKPPIVSPWSRSALAMLAGLWSAMTAAAQSRRTLTRELKRKLASRSHAVKRRHAWRATLTLSITGLLLVMRRRAPFTPRTRAARFS